MRYLASAWNRRDEVQLRHVTDPNARVDLDAMHSEAVGLTLTSCVARPGQGDYTCTFSHHYPKGYKKAGVGSAEFIVAPADRPGWYMTVLQGCG